MLVRSVTVLQRALLSSKKEVAALACEADEALSQLECTQADAQRLLDQNTLLNDSLTKVSGVISGGGSQAQLPGSPRALHEGEVVVSGEPRGSGEDSFYLEDLGSPVTPQDAQDEEVGEGQGWISAALKARGLSHVGVIHTNGDHRGESRSQNKEKGRAVGGAGVSFDALEGNAAARAEGLVQTNQHLRTLLGTLAEGLGSYPLHGVQGERDGGSEQYWGQSARASQSQSHSSAPARNPGGGDPGRHSYGGRQFFRGIPMITRKNRCMNRSLGPSIVHATLGGGQGADPWRQGHKSPGLGSSLGARGGWMDYRGTGREGVPAGVTKALQLLVDTVKNREIRVAALEREVRELRQGAASSQGEREGKAQVALEEAKVEMSALQRQVSAINENLLETADQILEMFFTFIQRLRSLPQRTEASMEAANRGEVEVIEAELRSLERILGTGPRTASVAAKLKIAFIHDSSGMGLRTSWPLWTRRHPRHRAGARARAKTGLDTFGSGGDSSPHGSPARSRRVSPARRRLEKGGDVRDVMNSVADGEAELESTIVTLEIGLVRLAAKRATFVREERSRAADLGAQNERNARSLAEATMSLESLRGELAAAQDELVDLRHQESELQKEGEDLRNKLEDQRDALVCERSSRQQAEEALSRLGQTRRNEDVHASGLSTNPKTPHEDSKNLSVARAAAEAELVVATSQLASARSELEAARPELARVRAELEAECCERRRLEHQLKEWRDGVGAASSAVLLGVEMPPEVGEQGVRPTVRMPEQVEVRHNQELEGGIDSSKWSTVEQQKEVWRMAKELRRVEAEKEDQVKALHEECRRLSKDLQAYSASGAVVSRCQTWRGLEEAALRHELKEVTLKLEEAAKQASASSPGTKALWETGERTVSREVDRHLDLIFGDWGGSNGLEGRDGSGGATAGNRHTGVSGWAKVSQLQRERCRIIEGLRSLESAVVGGGSRDGPESTALESSVPELQAEIGRARVQVSLLEARLEAAHIANSRLENALTKSMEAQAQAEERLGDVVEGEVKRHEGEFFHIKTLVEEMSSGKGLGETVTGPWDGPNPASYLVSPQVVMAGADSGPKMVLRLEDDAESLRVKLHRAEAALHKGELLLAQSERARRGMEEQRRALVERVAALEGDLEAAEAEGEEARREARLFAAGMEDARGETSDEEARRREAETQVESLRAILESQNQEPFVQQHDHGLASKIMDDGAAHDTDGQLIQESLDKHQGQPTRGTHREMQQHSCGWETTMVRYGGNIHKSAYRDTHVSSCTGQHDRLMLGQSMPLHKPSSTSPQTNHMRQGRGVMDGGRDLGGSGPLNLTDFEASWGEGLAHQKSPQAQNRAGEKRESAGMSLGSGMLPFQPWREVVNTPVTGTMGMTTSPRYGHGLGNGFTDSRTGSGHCT
ncbi:unnamed protein product [Discosporangium mesarthrocarpum]